jgi:hypothetical protein
MLMDTVRYELPPGGTTLLDYIVRRMHKTEWLQPVPDLLRDGQSESALARIAVYAAAASTSFGQAYYQPNFNPAGAQVSEQDPTTGAIVSSKLESRTPHYHITYTVNMPNGDQFEGAETITGTTLGFKGLGMPAPSRFSFSSPAHNYTAELIGTLTSELAPSLFGPWRIRAYGSLQFQDNTGNQGSLQLDRNGDLHVQVNQTLTEEHSLVKLVWHAPPLAG